MMHHWHSCRTKLKPEKRNMLVVDCCDFGRHGTWIFFFIDLVESLNSWDGFWMAGCTCFGFHLNLGFKLFLDLQICLQPSLALALQARYLLVLPFYPSQWSLIEIPQLWFYFCAWKRCKPVPLKWELSLQELGHPCLSLSQEFEQLSTWKPVLLVSQSCCTVNPIKD